MSARRAALVAGVLVLAVASGGGGWTLGHDHPRTVELVRTVERTRTITRTVYRTRSVGRRPAATPSASPSVIPSGCADACGQTEPVIFAAGSYSGTEPTSIDFSADGGNVPYGLVWSSWPSGPNGVVPADATATATGTVGIDNCVPSCATGTITPEPVTIVLSGPLSGSPSIWTRITEQIADQPPGSYVGTYTYPEPWPFGAS